MIKSLAFILLLLGLSHCKENYKFGFMLDENDNYAGAFENIINFAIAEFNDKSQSIELTPNVLKYNGGSLYKMVDASCDLLTDDIILAISPSNSNNIGVQADILNKVNMPMIASAASNSQLLTGSRDELFLMPPLDVMQAQVIVGILSKYGWMKLSIIASDSNYGIHGVTFFQQLLVETTAEESIMEEFDTSVYFFNALDDPKMINIDDIVTNVIASMDRVFLLHCEDHYGQWVLKKAHESGILGKDFVWILSEGITSSPQNLKFKLDDHDDVGYYPSYYEGLLGISLYVETESSAYKAFKDKALTALAGKIKPEDITPIVVMLYDAILMAGTALDDDELVKNRDLPPSPACGEEPWEGAGTIIESLIGYDYEGVSGSYVFTENHTITKNVKYRIVNFMDSGTGAGGMFSSIGTWTAESRLQITSEEVQFLGGSKVAPRGVANNLNSRHMYIGAVHGPPFALNPTGCKENECWSGITPTVMKKLSVDLNFTYEFVSPEDGKYGHFNETTKIWSGMVGDLLLNKVDMIAMDLTVSSQRRAYIDFTTSFLETGVSSIIKGESKTGTKFFFLSPFGLSTWVAIMIAFVIISFVQSFVAKLSPFDDHGKVSYATRKCVCSKCTWRRTDEMSHEVSNPLEPCLVDEAEEECAETKSTVMNSLWMVAGSLVGQGGDPLPRSPSGRVIVLTWWFFVMLIVNMYAANLTAFMTLDKRGVPIKKSTDLLTQSEYGWGIRPRSSTGGLMKFHINEQLRELALKATPMETFDSCLARVNEGGFAIFEDHLWLEYNISNSCDVFFIEEKLLAVPVAFGLPNNSPYAHLLNKYILKYREHGYFNDLWTEMGTGERMCGGDVNIGNDKTLEFSTLAGIFYILFGGLGLGILFLLVELVCASMGDASKKTSFSKSLIQRVTAPVSGEVRRGDKINSENDENGTQIRIHKNHPGELEMTNANEYMSAAHRHSKRNT